VLLFSEDGGLKLFDFCRKEKFIFQNQSYTFDPTKAISTVFLLASLLFVILSEELKRPFASRPFRLLKHIFFHKSLTINALLS
jgi:hypothetical protein